MSHTPGPWITMFGGEPQQIGTHPNSGQIIAVADNVKNYADAKLIAAAPDLLEAMKAAIDLVRQCEEDTFGTPSQHAFGLLARKWEVLVAKAESRS